MDKIDPVTERSKESTKRLLAMWQQYFDQLQHSIDNPDFEISSIHTNVSILARYIFSSDARECNLTQKDLIARVNLVDLRNAYKPGWKQITPLVTGILASLVGGCVGVAPSVGGYTGNTAATCTATSSMIQGVVGGGSQGIGQMANTLQSGEQALVNHKLQAEKENMGDNSQARNQHAQAVQQAQQKAASDEQRRHELMKVLMNAAGAS